MIIVDNTREEKLLDDKKGEGTNNEYQEEIFLFLYIYIYICISESFQTLYPSKYIYLSEYPSI